MVGGGAMDSALEQSGEPPRPGSAEEAEARRNVGKGPFSVAKANTGCELVEVLDASGAPFAQVIVAHCVGKDITAAKARASRIAEALNGRPYETADHPIEYPKPDGDKWSVVYDPRPVAPADTGNPTPGTLWKLVNPSEQDRWMGRNVMCLTIEGVTNDDLRKAWAHFASVMFGETADMEVARPRCSRPGCMNWTNLVAGRCEVHPITGDGATLEEAIHRARFLPSPPEPNPMDSTDRAYAERIAKGVRDWLVMQEPEPIPMVLHCPSCGTQHIDAPSEGWDNPPHRSHLCDFCGCIWRPADVPTVGVAATETRSEADTWPLDLRDAGDLLAGPPAFGYHAIRDLVLEEAAKVCEGVESWGLSPTKLEVAQSTQRFCAKAIRAQRSDSEERQRQGVEPPPAVVRLLSLGQDMPGRTQSRDIDGDHEL